MVRAIVARLVGLFRREHQLVEAWSAVVLTGWGVQNITDGNDLRYIGAYRMIAQFVPEPALEIAAIAMGAFQAVALLRQNHKGRGAAAFMACAAYSLFLISFFVSPDITPPGMMFCAGWVGVNAVAVARLARGMD